MYLTTPISSSLPQHKPLVFCNDSPGWGGSEKSMLRVASFLSATYRLAFVLNPWAVDNLRDEVSKLAGTYRTFFTPASVLRMPWSLLRAAWLSWHYRNSVFIIWCHHPDSNRWLQWWLAFSRRKFIVIERSVPADAEGFKKSRLTLPIKRFVIRRAFAVVQAGWSAAEQYEQLFGRPAQIRVVPNARPVVKIHQEVKQLRALSQKSFPYIGKVICTVGRLHHSKGLISLIHAYALVFKQTPCSLLIVGEGPDEQLLKAEVQELGLQYVFFSGYTSHIEHYLAQADVFVLNSLLEGLPGALIEAMAAGLPCIATDIPGNRELVHHMKTGLQVPVNNPQALAEAINTYLGNQQLAEAHASNGFNWVLDTYAIEQEMIKWLQLVADLQQ